MGQSRTAHGLPAERSADLQSAYSVNNHVTALIGNATAPRKNPLNSRGFPANIPGSDSTIRRRDGKHVGWIGVGAGLFQAALRGIGTTIYR